MKHFLLSVHLVLLFHLQSFAGGIFTFSGNKLQPVISVAVTEKQALEINQDLPVKAARILSLHLVTDNVAATLPVSGKYILKGNNLSFTPLYPLGNGLSYEIQYQGNDGQLTRQKFTTPDPPFSKEKAAVSHIYPLADTIPSNILFFHVRFSHPMADDMKAYTYVSIADGQGKLIENTWRQRSFWLDSGRLLVLMIHPGRVKTGIHYIGPVFEQGKKYTIRVDRKIKDINGNAIKEKATRQYVVKGEDRDLPRITEISTSPDAYTSKPINITFSEGIDHAAATDGIKIYKEGKELIPCLVRQTGSDKVVSIVPAMNWEKGSYKILFESVVSDFAANNLNRPFEITDIREKGKDSIEVSRYFEVK